MKYRLDPRRLAFAGARNTGVGGQFSQVALFNNSTGAQLLSIFDVSLGGDAAAGWVLYTQLGQIGSNPVAGQYIMVGEPAPPGIVTTFNSASNPPFGFFSSFQNGSAPGRNQVPFCILLPGWSAVISDFTTAAVFTVTFHYQVDKAQDLDPFREPGP